MRYIALLAIILLTSFAPLSAATFDTAKLSKLIAAVDKHQKIMGALTVSSNGKTVYNRAWGYRSVSNKQYTPNDTETKFRIGSITKTFTAVMIIQLIEEGKLSLDTRLAKFYPNIPNAAEITIEQLLNHHSGLYNFTDSAYLTYHTQAKTKQELLALFAKHTPSFKPGTEGAYSNTNYVLLGFILEDITKDSYATNLKKRITGKLGLKSTYYGDKPSAAKNEASSFSFSDDGWKEEPETHLSIPGGAGALVSTPNDLVKFMEGLFAGKLLKKVSLDKMLDLKNGYGQGIFQFPFDEKHCYGHTGGIDEFHAMLAYFPAERVAFAFTGNGQTMDMNDLAIGVMSICFDKAYEIPDFAAQEYKLAAEKLAAYEGTYSSQQLPIKIKVWKEGSKLLAQATGQGAFPLTAVSEREFKFDPAKLKMIFDLTDSGNATQFTLKQGGGQFVFVKE